MEISLLDIDINRRSESYIQILKVNWNSLFYIQWNYKRKITMLELFYIKIK